MSTDSFVYPALFSADEDGRILVSLPDFPAAHTDGKDRREAMMEAIDLLGSVISRLMANGQQVPAPSAMPAGSLRVPVPLWIAGKLALYDAVSELGISNSELARRLGVRETVVRRMLDPDHATKSEKLQIALAALGRYMTVSVSAA